MPTNINLPIGCNIDIPVDIPDFKLPEIDNIDLPLDIPDVDIPDLSINLQELFKNDNPCLNVDITACNLDIFAKAIERNINILKDLPRDNLTKLKDQANKMISEFNSLMPTKENIVNFAQDLISGNLGDPVNQAQLYKKWKNVVDDKTFQKILQGWRAGRLDLCEVANINSDGVKNAEGQFTTKVIKKIEPLVPSRIPDKVQASVNTLETKLAKVSPFAYRSSITQKIETPAEKKGIQYKDAWDAYYNPITGYHTYEIIASETFNGLLDSNTNDKNIVAKAFQNNSKNADYLVALKNDLVDDFIKISTDHKKAHTLYMDLQKIEKLNNDISSLNSNIRTTISATLKKEWSTLYEKSANYEDYIDYDYLLEVIQSNDPKFATQSKQIYEAWKNVWDQRDAYLKYVIGTNQVS